MVEKEKWAKSKKKKVESRAEKPRRKKKSLWREGAKGPKKGPHRQGDQ